eukprot:TRINITY_DN67249_c6_g6_i2.p1 TRINITY_DN67249_c6_g6~~TRINITY_DN67249_c6_g6_i2.p1  ORF type:complete len:254 (-),score=10.84 TRINITY_DN67249_c6_g6_i2:163-924(-)
MTTTTELGTAYTHCFCEENIFNLIQHLQEQQQPSDHLYAVFFSSCRRQATPGRWRSFVPLFSVKGTEPLVVWDYHVVALHFKDGEALIYDFDTALSLGCTAQHYVRRTFLSTALGEELGLDIETFAQVELLTRNVEFKVIPADFYLQNFSSDRCHMKPDPKVPFPDYPCIKKGEDAFNLNKFINMADSSNGHVMDLGEFFQLVTKQPHQPLSLSQLSKGPQSSTENNTTTSNADSTPNPQPTVQTTTEAELTN